ncbi:Sec39-domain-containing protein [Pholiota conissans]|uniref:Sec39-domain-containing protein n=1 Tax=Pholiota conissans TaxID=109636 RepID=A0A9P5YXE8_9AGAR|nr:Sec39-domain-containing protein [Pholiota conissans]
MSASNHNAWLNLDDDELTDDAVNTLLAPIHNDLWVTSACVDRILNDTPVQHTLLTLGLSRTDRVIERCTNLAALASPSPQGANSKLDTLLHHFQNTPTDALLCYLRSVLLRRLDRLSTYMELEKVFPKHIEVEIEDVIEEWEDDPWADGNATSSSSRPTPPSNPTQPPPVSFADFLQNDLLWSACELAALEAFDSLRILQQKHNAELWPARFKIQSCIPEHAHPSDSSNTFPSLDPSLNRETVSIAAKWRDQPDFSELPLVQEALKGSGIPLPSISDSEKKLAFTPILDPLTADELSAWYKDRVQSVISSTGMIDIALALVQHAASQGIPALDELGEELSLLAKLVYDAPQSNIINEDWTLDSWYSMDPTSVVHAYLAHASPEVLPHCISHLVMPYLYVLEAKAERIGKPDPALATRILYEYILTTSLENVAAIFEASKPTLPYGQRIISNDEDMVRVALACLYSSDILDQWTTMSGIFECLPVWNVPQDEENDIGEAGDTTITSLGVFVTPSTNQPPCTAMDLMVFLQPLHLPSLSRLLDILDVHLESGEILSRWSVAAPLRWFLQSSDNIREQRAWANRMARRAGEKDDKLQGLDDWEWLLQDMLKLTGNGESSARSAFCLLSREEVSSIFLTGLLTSDNFEIAKLMLYGHHHKLKLSQQTVEAVCLAASREFYDNASSGNYKIGDMKLAYECLEVPRPSETIAQEKEFIEATSRISSFNVSSSPGVAISPIEIRLTKDRLSLISRVLSSNDDAYKHTQVILDLGYKLGYRNDTIAEVKILAMLADTALQAEDFARAYENNERMVELVTGLRNSSQSEWDDTKVRETLEVCWIACFQLGRQPEFPDLAKKLILLCHALEFCPPDKIHDVLMVWRRLESEDIQRREEKLTRGITGKPNAVGVPRATAMGTFTGRNVASSLRARLHDFHMPSPPLLSTPDAAALATRTFKSVAANFPFGHRGRSDIDERSEGSRRTDGQDVSSQASRVFSKGIGWLIGADEAEL